VIKPLFLQVGALTLVVALGGGFVAWLVAVKRTSSEFLIATDGEMKKVNWSTRKEILGSTWVVIVACALIAGVLFVLDSGFYQVFKLVGILESA
jgi:preprotein translocase subunit SecE